MKGGAVLRVKPVSRIERRKMTLSSAGSAVRALGVMQEGYSKSER